MQTNLPPSIPKVLAGPHFFQGILGIKPGPRDGGRRLFIASVYPEDVRTAYIGMGANLPSIVGEPETTLASAVVRLGSLGRVAARSSLYSTAPVGLADQPRFLNAAVRLETELTPFELLGALLLIEQEYGRNRILSVSNGPRTLDLDILLYGDYVLGGPALDVPHPRLTERAFVLIPLNEIAPETRHPPTAKSVKELLESFIADPGNEIDAVLPHKSEVWRADASRDAGLG